MGDLQALLVELLITLILVFVVIPVATDDRVLGAVAPVAVAPVAVGLALAACVFIAGGFTAAWVYVVGLAALLQDRFISASEESG